MSLDEQNRSAVRLPGRGGGRGSRNARREVDRDGARAIDRSRSLTGPAGGQAPLSAAVRTGVREEQGHLALSAMEDVLERDLDPGLEVPRGGCPRGSLGLGRRLTS